MYAELSDLEAVLGRELTDAETPQAEVALRYASSLAGSLAPWADWSTTVPEVVTDCVATLAARRFLARLDGMIAVGPFRYSSTDASFTADEQSLIVGATPMPAGVGGASFTLSLGTPDP